MIYKIKSANTKIDGRPITRDATRLNFRKGDHIQFFDTDQDFRIKHVTHIINAKGVYLHTNLFVDR